MITKSVLYSTYVDIDQPTLNFSSSDLVALKTEAILSSAVIVPSFDKIVFGRIDQSSIPDNFDRVELSLLVSGITKTGSVSTVDVSVYNLESPVVIGEVTYNTKVERAALIRSKTIDLNTFNNGILVFDLTDYVRALKLGANNNGFAIIIENFNDVGSVSITTSRAYNAVYYKVSTAIMLSDYSLPIKTETANGTANASFINGEYTFNATGTGDFGSESQAVIMRLNIYNRTLNVNQEAYFTINSINSGSKLIIGLAKVEFQDFNNGNFNGKPSLFFEIRNNGTVHLLSYDGTSTATLAQETLDQAMVNILGVKLQYVASTKILSFFVLYSGNTTWTQELSLTLAEGLQDYGIVPFFGVGQVGSGNTTIIFNGLATNGTTLGIGGIPAVTTSGQGFYRPPGVTVIAEKSISSVQLPSGARIPAIIGFGSEIKSAINEVVKRKAGTNEDLLKHTDIQQIMIVGNTVNAKSYTAGVDYTINNDATGILWIGNKPADNENYFVSYIYARPQIDYYVPKLFFSPADAYSEYGSPSEVNTLPLGIEIAFQNGAPAVIGVQVPFSNNPVQIRANFAAGLQSLENEEAFHIPVPDVIVPLLADVDFIDDLVNHVDKMSGINIQRPRIGIVGLPVTVSDPTVFASVASSIFNERIVVLAPSSATRTLRDPFTGFASPKVLDGSFLAAALGGLACRYDVATPLTRKDIVGFDALNQFFLKEEKDYMAMKGVCILEPRGSRIVVRHGMTTDVSVAESNEISVVMIKHYLIKIFLAVFDELFIGNKFTGGEITDISQVMTGILDSLILDNIIQNKGNIMVTRDPNEPRKANVSLSIMPIYPLNWIEIRFSLTSKL